MPDLFNIPLGRGDKEPQNRLPVCPACGEKFYVDADQCPRCGFSLHRVLKEYGEFVIECSRIEDKAGCLTKEERARLRKVLVSLEKKTPPVLLTVHTMSGLDPRQLRYYATWYMNALRFNPNDFANKDRLDPRWMLCLVVDVSNKGALFAGGYKLDPFVNEKMFFTALSSGEDYLVDGDYAKAFELIMRKMSALLIKSIAKFNPMDIRGMLKGDRSRNHGENKLSAESEEKPQETEEKGDRRVP